MSRDRRMYALAEALSVFAEALNDRAAEDYVDRVWMRLRSVLDWLYQCEEGERSVNPDYYRLRGESQDGRTLAALIWVRGLVVHRQAEVDIPAIVKPRQTFSVSLNPTRARVRSATGLQYGLIWVSRDQLPEGPPERFNRDALYDELVAQQSILVPLAASVRFLRQFGRQD